MMPPQPFATCPVGVNQFGEETSHVLAWRQPSVACNGGIAGMTACDCPLQNCVLPPPPPSFAPSAAAYSPPIFTAAVPSPMPHPTAYTPGTVATYPNPVCFPPPPAYWQFSQATCGQPGCACPSCCGPACDCAATTEYHPQVVYPASQCGWTTSGGSCADRLDHILEAVHHLEAAGLTADADRLRHQCDAEMKTVVERLKQTEAELARLRQSQTTNTTSAYQKASDCGSSDCKLTDAKSAAQKQVTVHVQLMEINLTKCRMLGFDFAKTNGDGCVPSEFVKMLNAPLAVAAAIPGDFARFGTVDGNSALPSLLQSLRKEGVVKVLSDPSICTVSGRPASFSCGSEVPFPWANVSENKPVEYRLVGTKIDCVPIIRDDGKVRLEIRTRWSQLDPTRSITVAHRTVPGLKVREFDTGAEMNAGQALVICGPVEKRVQTEHTVQVPPILNRLPSCIVESAWFDDLAAAISQRAEFARQEEIEFLAVVTPEILEPQDCPVKNFSDDKPASAGAWIESAMNQAKSNCIQPACCDEGPACKCAPACCAAEKSCAQTQCLTEAKSIFASPATWEPFGSQTIYVDPATFSAPATHAAALVRFRLPIALPIARVRAGHYGAGAHHAASRYAH